MDAGGPEGDRDVGAAAAESSAHDRPRAEWLSGVVLNCGRGLDLVPPGQPLRRWVPGELHGQRSLAGYSPWDCKESDTIEQQMLILIRDKLLPSSEVSLPL